MKRVIEKFKILDRKSRILIDVIAVSLIITIASISYAFFSVSGIPQGKDTVITTGTMRLEYDDGQEVSAANLTPGHGVTKTFRVKNIGNVDTTYDVFLSEVINTFVDKDDLVYTIESSNGCPVTVETTMPSVSGEESKMITNCAISPNITHEYTLNILFKETNDNQNDNAGKTFSAKISVNEYSVTEGIAVANEYIEQANAFYSLNSTSSSLGTNMAETLNVENKASDDQVVITKDGKVELAVKRNNRCFRKSAVRDEVQVIDSDSCNPDITRFVSNNGQLHVCGANLCGEDNSVVRMTGVSAAGLGGERNYNNPAGGNINTESLNSARNWGANILRVFIETKKQWMAQYIDHEDEYIAGLKTIIDAAIEADIYILINWDPAMNDGNPYTEKAAEAFTRIANLYPNDPHIMYEVWNEPEIQKSWDDVKTHARTVISAIRTVSPNAVAMVGSPGANSNLNYALEDPITDISNIMYSNHAYMRNINAEAIGYLYQAIQEGLPFFITEWGPQGEGNDSPTVLANYTEEYVNLIQKYNLNYAMFCFAEGKNSNVSADKYAILPEGMWNNALPESLLTPQGKVMKHILNGLSYELKGGVLNENPATTADAAHTYRSSAYADKIISITFANQINVPNNAVEQWDLSLFRDNSVVGYITNSSTSGKYDMTIAANGTISSPKYAKYLFARMTNLKTINFNNNFDTVNAKVFTSMFFLDSQLESLDFSGFDSRRIDDMGGLCNGCNNLQSVNFSGFTPKLTYAYNMFTSCGKLESIDLSGFNVDNVTSLSAIFYNMPRLKTVNISSWNPTNLTSVKDMFGRAWALENVDMRNIDIQSTTTITAALDGVKTGARFIVKNQNVIDYLNPTATNVLSYQIAQ